jgi:hypothetical protein
MSHEANQLEIDLSPLPAAPLPGMAASHQLVGTKGVNSLDLSPPKLLPSLPFVLHGSPTSSMRTSTPSSPFIAVGQNTLIFRPNPLSVSSPKVSSPFTCPGGENQCRTADHGRASPPLPWSAHGGPLHPGSMA